MTDADAFMGVTDYIDDEKPLYVRTDDKLGITGFCFCACFRRFLFFLGVLSAQRASVSLVVVLPVAVDLCTACAK